MRKPGMSDGRTWADARMKAQAGLIEVRYCDSTMPGVGIAEAHLDGETQAIGWVWWKHETGNVISINMSFVHFHVRRCGVRTAIHNELLKWFPETRQFVTGRATNESRPWLEKMGFVFNEWLDRWELNFLPDPDEAQPRA